MHPGLKRRDPYCTLLRTRNTALLAPKKNTTPHSKMVRVKPRYTVGWTNGSAPPPTPTETLLITALRARPVI